MDQEKQGRVDAKETQFTAGLYTFAIVIPPWLQIQSPVRVIPCTTSQHRSPRKASARGAEAI